MKQCQILVVDDDIEDQEIISEHFNKAGFLEGVSYVENGQEAINFLETMVASKCHLPRLVILDLNMPVLNGTETLAKLKTDPRYKDVPVVIFSTSDNGIEKEKCLAFGAEDYIIKPMTYKEGQNVMKKFLSLLDKKKA
jgi:CheY-like chemotaxis protein